MARREQRHDVAEMPEPQDVRDVIGRNIKTAQAAKGLTTEELSRQTGIAVRLVQKHRAGDNAPGHANLIRYSAVLDRPLAWFFERHGEEAAA